MVIDILNFNQAWGIDPLNWREIENVKFERETVLGKPTLKKPVKKIRVRIKASIR